MSNPPTKAARPSSPEERPSQGYNEDFLGNLAHELRNPLAPLRNGIQIIRMSKGDPSAIEGTLDVMERQLQRLVKLIDDLLEASRLRRGELELHKHTIDLAGVIQSAVKETKPALESQGQKLTVLLPATPVFVEGDARWLTEAIVHLLDNASKFSNRGGQVELFTEVKAGDVAVSIVDNGVGIPPQMLGGIFEIFTKADRSLEKGHDGLGIGLAVVKTVVEMHGGRVEARSGGLGAGSEFVVHLPVVAGPRSKTEAVANKPAAGSLRRVLVVDDNKDCALSLAMVLKMLGNETQTAHDGVEALRVAAAFRPDIVLLDIGMPKLNGYDVCRVIREQPWGKEVTLVALTGWGGDEDSSRSKEAGFDHHLVKPVETTDLEKIVNQVFPRRPEFAHA